ncbi:MAG: diguanylate cyclase [Lachnospira sp.]|nr:diguanylate cyclase [Lachnospira sp.]
MKGLNRTQLKLIAISAMVCDHVAWGFVEFMSPLGQFMHIIGRFTLPIMCFFIAEGFRHTSSVKRYIKRMALFCVVAILPFYIFFGEIYEYRQNIIFDLLLGVILLAILENKKLKKWQKAIPTVGLFVISALIGGWVIMPMVYILIFYYVKSFKKQAILFSTLTVVMEVFIIVGMQLNQIWHFTHYDWPWYDKLYLLGFMLPLLVLKHYNGQKGKDIGGRYFFYIFYSVHFVVLAVAKALVAGCSAYEIYVALHIIALLVWLAILIMVLWAKPSRGQVATLLLLFSGGTYIFGFLVEITSGNVGGFYAATLMQYFGECILMLGFTMLVAQMCHREVPAFIYAMEVVFGLFVMWMLFTTRENHIFYEYIGIDESGPFPRLVLEHGFGFMLFVAYMVIVCVSCLVLCVLGIRKSVGIERKRIICMALAIICPWLPNVIRAAGITGGYEVPGFGIMGAAIFVGMALLHYGYFDSITLAGENALSHGQEGIMVINNNRIITYYNNVMQEVFGQLVLKQSAYNNKTLEDIFEGRLKTLELEGSIYEMRVEPLREGGYVQGQMLWMLDITEHHKMLAKISDLAHKDSLTMVYNRGYFETLLEEYLEQGGDGSLFMIDIRHFRQINDRFGHQAGDNVLVRFGEVLLSQGDDTISCRIGGDEFCLFFKEAIDAKELECMAERILTDFKKTISNEKYADIVDVAFGIARILDASEKNFHKLYSNADKALYVAKNRSNNAWYIL